jgi:hypothetical protein
MIPPDRASFEAAAGELDQHYRAARKEFGFALLPAVMALATLVGLRRQRRQMAAELHHLELAEAGQAVATVVEAELPRWGYDREGLRVELVDGWEPTLFQGGRIVAQIPLGVTTRQDACRWLQGRMPRPADFVVDSEGEVEEFDEP